MTNYIERVKVHELIEKMADGYEYLEVPVKHLTDKINSIPAADAIEELSKPKWIPVGERLPDADGFTLIFTAHGHPGVCYFTSGWWGGYDKDGITHWMPLPQAPKEE